MLAGATWPGGPNVAGVLSWGPQPGFSTPAGSVITSFLPLLHKTNPQSWPLAQQGQGLQTSGRVAGAEAALERREPRPGLTVGFDTHLAI